MPFIAQLVIAGGLAFLVGCYVGDVLTERAIRAVRRWWRRRRAAIAD